MNSVDTNVLVYFVDEYEPAKQANTAVNRTEKLSIYAEAGITDYWIVNLIDNQIEV